MRAVRWLLITLLCLSVWTAAPIPAQAGAPIKIAVWADSDPSSNGGNGIFAFINGLEGYSATMVTTVQLNTPRFLADNDYSAIYITRFAQGFGSSLSPRQPRRMWPTMSVPMALSCFS